MLIHDKVVKLSKIQKNVFTMYFILYFACIVFMCFFSTKCDITYTTCSIMLTSEIKMVDFLLALLSPKQKCQFSAFLITIFSTCLDCTLPVTKTHCFTLVVLIFLY